MARDRSNAMPVRFSILAVQLQTSSACHRSQMSAPNGKDAEGVNRRRSSRESGITMEPTSWNYGIGGWDRGRGMGKRDRVDGRGLYIRAICL